MQELCSDTNRSGSDSADSDDVDDFLANLLQSSIQSGFELVERQVQGFGKRFALDQICRSVQNSCVFVHILVN